MLQRKALTLFTCSLALAGNLILALPFGPGAWTSYESKPVYSRALGPFFTPGINTIPVPYMPKSPFFPKFVDPKMMISKKTDMLNNLFGGSGPVTYDAANSNPSSIPYGTNESAFDNSDKTNVLLNKKSDTLPEGQKAIISDNGMLKRGMFGPFAPKFGPMSPKFGSLMPLSPADTASDYDQEPFSRKRRSTETSSSTDDVDSALDSKSRMTNSILASVSKDPEAGKSKAMLRASASGVPKEYLAGPFGMYGPFGPAVDPSAFIGKKSTFLDELFKNIAANPATTETPTPKSTIVPPSFWMPSSIISGPAEYNSKVSDFLDKLFDSIKLNATADGSPGAQGDFMKSSKVESASPDRIARSSEDLPSITAAKDAIVDTIMSELSDLKGDMIATLNDLIAYEKTTAATAAATKKPFKPFPGMWSKPTVDPTLPFQQRMIMLSQVFDMLTSLQRNITLAAKSAITANANNSEPPTPSAVNAIDAAPINVTLLNAVLRKLSTIATATTSYPESLSTAKASPITLNGEIKEPTPFWMSYPENAAPAVKRQVNDDYFTPYLGNNRHDRYSRDAKMYPVYQSLPTDYLDPVEARGGSIPGHQRDIELPGPNAYGNTWADWMQYHKNGYQDQEYHRHHHNHH